MDIRKIAVVGAGTMGQGIAQQCAICGIDVILLDVSEVALQKASTAIDQRLVWLVELQKIDGARRDEAYGRIRYSTDYESAAAADLFIEAATENLTVKSAILGKLEAVASSEALVATNTSSLSITRLASVLKDRTRFIGMHFFNPVTVLPLVEVVRGLSTSDATHSSVLAFCEKIGKKPISVRNSPGFLVNRLLCPMINEAVFALQEGVATAQDIDLGMKLGCNQPIGPLALADLIGLDTLLAIMQVLASDFGDQKFRPAQLLIEMVDAGRLGRKSGQGFFTYC
ncbi:3-hydroxyacyl-CoA dehydrogenase NAD-binding domain-containing protein [Paraburkholderia sp. MM5384-R2]|uniref:3-hydroxyacyl-CoA dehydrogenase NAD-binding domain-containing protein n=1 Tax=Paraburkholderia sp. MM5384-R2 TaxID=2723097 RepID=UPI0016076589|nr:3-hydroxyacyl-CoA dehydrogenase NAD-binding domain-containing protein [Paraburkholderia sp. MM5384-R2]